MYQLNQIVSNDFEPMPHYITERAGCFTLPSLLNAGATTSGDSNCSILYLPFYQPAILRTPGRSIFLSNRTIASEEVERQWLRTLLLHVLQGFHTSVNAVLALGSCLLITQKFIIDKIRQRHFFIRQCFMCLCFNFQPLKADRKSNNL